MEFYEAVYHAERSALCHYPCIPVKGLKRRICFQTESFCHHLVCDRKYLSGGNSIPLNQEHDTVKEKLKVSCVCSQLSLIFRHPSPSTSMYFTLFPYFFPCEESIREKVFFSS